MVAKSNDLVLKFISDFIIFFIPVNFIYYKHWAYSF